MIQIYLTFRIYVKSWHPHPQTYYFIIVLLPLHWWVKSLWLGDPLVLALA